MAQTNGKETPTAEERERTYHPTPLSRWLRKRRGELDLTQAEVAARIPVEQSYLSQLERGRPPSTDLQSIKALATALEVPTAVLLSEMGLDLANRYTPDTCTLPPTLQALLAEVADLDTAQIELLAALARAQRRQATRTRRRPLAGDDAPPLTAAPDPPER